MTTRSNTTNAGNGSKAICHVSNVFRSPSPDPSRSATILKPLISLIALIAASTTVVADQIGTLVESLSKSHTWINGGYPKIDTPKGASAKDVITAYCKMSSFQDGSRIHEFTVLEERTVKISGPLPDSYIATRCKTDHGPMIFVLQYKEKPGQWWVKQYDAPAEAAPGQPATRPESKPEGEQKPHPKSEGRSR